MRTRSRTTPASNQSQEVRRARSVPGRAFALATLVWALQAGSVGATTIIPFTDAELVDRAPVIVEAIVEGQVANTTDLGKTRWLVTVIRVLKGEVLEGAIVVEVPGGLTASGDAVFVYGAPSFRPEDRALLFLEPGINGNWRLFQFVQGAFVAREIGGRRAAFRPLADVKLLGDEPIAEREPGSLRSYERFTEWIGNRAHGEGPAAVYQYKVAPSEIEAVTKEYTLLPDLVCGTGLRARWFEFDSKGSVGWKNVGGLQWLPSTGADEFFRGLSAWNAEPTTPVNLRYTGGTSATRGAFGFDGKTTVIFDDPFDEIPDLDQTTCKGTLGVGIPKSRSCAKGTFNGQRYVRLDEADIVINNDLSCAFQRSQNPSEYAEALFAHELGHTLGIGHTSQDEFESSSALREALMYYLIHNDGRGARLTTQDVLALQALYRKSSGGTPGCPANTLCLMKKRFQVTVSWENQFGGTAGIGGPIPDTDLAGFFYFTDPKNVELLVKLLDFGGTVKVFYSQLTNFNFEMTILDTVTGVSKTYRNTPGDCGAIDHTAFAFSPPPAGTLLDEASDVSLEAGTCRQDSDTLCLLGNRFDVEVVWRNHYSGVVGLGKARRLSDLTGAFWFTQPANLELLVKALDFGDRILVLYGSLSDFEYIIRVTDTTTGIYNDYYNPPGNFCGGIDDNAF